MVKRKKDKISEEEQLLKELKQKIEFSKLKIVALNIMIDLAEEKYNISIRPKENNKDQ